MTTWDAIAAAAKQHAAAAECECVGYTIRTDYGTGIEYDVDRENCPLHAPTPDDGASA
jgi:hypothetical protein